MVANNFLTQQFLNNSDGQSILEFIFMLPLMIGITLLLIKANTAIQIAINNQQYARAQALFLAYNSPSYPFLIFRLGDASSTFIQQGSNLMTIGVSENVAPENGDYEPEAPVVDISRPGQQSAGSNEAQSEPSRRTKVRIRATVGLCTQDNFLGGGTGSNVPITALNVQSRGMTFNFCRSPYQ